MKGDFFYFFLFHTKSTSFMKENGQLEALKWLRERKCPWDKRTLLSASKGNHMDVLEWAVVHHCPRD
jgi:hypothetical protein